MEDRKILELYLTRSEQAIRETEAKYGGYCYSVAMNILENRQDAQECVSDTWFSAWNSIPPQSPRVLATFLGSITRNLAIDRWRERRAGKRGGGEMQLALDELSGCVPGGESPEGEVLRRELLKSVAAFLGTLPETERSVFLCRYWYFDSAQDIRCTSASRRERCAPCCTGPGKSCKAILRGRDCYEGNGICEAAW